MRLTYVLGIDVLAKVVFPEIYSGSACNERFRKEIGRIEVEDGGDHTGHMWRAQQAAEKLRPIAERELSLPVNWREFGKVTIRLVENDAIPELPNGLEGADPSVRCPDCDSAMKVRKGRGGSLFYGCTQYPSCRGTRPISK